MLPSDIAFINVDPFAHCFFSGVLLSRAKGLAKHELRIVVYFLHESGKLIRNSL